MILSKRETRAYLLLVKINNTNKAGKTPSKADIVNTLGMPNQTRSDQYRIIDTLISRGLVEDLNRNAPGSYALKVTDLGATELAQWSRS